MAQNPLAVRLLDLYPLEQLRQYFDLPTGTKAQVIEAILGSRDGGEVDAFIITHHLTTKHHVHLHRCSDVTVRDLPEGLLDDGRLLASDPARTSRSWFYLLDLPYVVYLADPLEKKAVDYLWPVHVTCGRNSLELRFTIMEKNLAAQYEPGRVIRSIKDLDEAMVEILVFDSLGLSDVHPEDLNEGVKALWDEGLIDAPAVQFKKARATTRQVMDGNYLVKRDDPSLYDDLRDKPLLATTFKWMGDSIGLDHFTVDPTKGIVSFRTFSHLDQGAAYVVREIRRRNG
ncbi:MAG TPA: hypothetical protein VGS57_01965 [Thermoanaerobaculia bacterium]|nr:hypothetical protein [Thermoanaerobaculia bacterium]